MRTAMRVATSMAMYYLGVDSERQCTWLLPLDYLDVVSQRV